MYMIAIKYTAFAVLATMANLLLQYLSLSLYDGVASLYLAMAAGTMAGLLAKYILDRKYIFYHKSVSRKNDIAKFVLYSLTGVFTTFIFWGTEIAFDTLLNTEGAKYLGAVTGLTIGYVIKYYLDKTYVFREQSV
ncbi:MAG: GtrA family protein [Gammaproteobacteria bacterium]|nr:GtrA family protein [Gammaproteobacteria bacterium]